MPSLKYYKGESFMARKKVVVFLMAFVLMALVLPVVSPMTVSAHQTVTVDVPQPAAYPSSPGELGQPAYGEIMWGQLHGCRTGWGGTNEGSGVRAAFQGNANTFFDPAGETQDCFVGMVMPEPYFLTEVRILRRAGRNDRFDGMMLQGSNDGAAWTTLHHVQLIPGDPGVGAPIGNTGRRYLLSSEGWRVIPAYEIEHNTGWTHFRWVTQGPGLHGDVAEVEFWGTSDPSEVPTYSPHILRNAEIVDYSSATAANPVTNVNNMSRRTRWQVESGDNNHFITFDLGDVTEFQRLSVLEWRSNTEGWALLGSNDNATWGEIVSANTGFPDSADLSPFFHVNFDPVNYRYVRFEFTGQSASFWEIGLFNSSVWIPTVYVPPTVFDTRTLTLYTFCVSERHYMDLYDLRRSNFADIQPLDFILPVGISFRVRQTNPNFQGNHMWDVQGARNDTRTFTGNITMQLHNRYSGRQQVTIPPTGEWVTVQSGNNMPVIPVIRTPYTPVGYAGGPPVLEFEILCEDYLLEFFQRLADNPPPYVPAPPFNPASLTTIPAGSRAAGQPELPAMNAPATGEIMRGEPIGMGAGWGSNIRGPFNGNVNPASSNIFDPAARATRTHPDGWVGMRMPERYILSEIRMIMRPGRNGRLQGGMIFGWNGGGRFDPNTATLIWQHESTVGGQNLDPPNTPAPWFVITPDMFEAGANTGFTSFAYVNFYNHGEVNELELWGTGTGITDGGGGNGAVTLPHRIHLPVYTYTNSRTWIQGVNDDFTDISAWDAWITPEATAAHAQFISEWTDQPYAIIRGNSVTIVVAEADFFRVRDLVHFVNLDQLLGYYDHMYAVYDWLSGLDPAHHQNGHFVYWQDTDWDNVMPQHASPATTVLATPSHPGAGMGYWASTHMGQAGYSVFAYLYRSWLTLHEVGHGYHGTHFGHQGNMPMGETWNDVFSFFYQSMYIMPVQPIFEGGSMIVNSWAYYQDRPFHERRVRDLRLSGRSFANNTEDRFRLWFFIPMFEYLGPEGLRDFNRMYREMFATNQDGIRNWTQQDVFLTLLYRTSGYNFLPYFQEWHKNAANATTRAEIENGVILRILYDEVPYPAVRRALIEAHGLVSDFSLIPEHLVTEEAIRELLGLCIYNNGPGGTQYPRPNASLTEAGLIRIRPQVSGEDTLINYSAAATIVARDQDGECAREFIHVHRIWCDDDGWLDYFMAMDVNKHGDWQYINFYITMFGQTLHVLLANAFFEAPVSEVTVTFVVEAGAVGVYATNTSYVELLAGELIPADVIPNTDVRAGFYFAGWYPSDPAEYGYVTEDITFTARFNPLFHYVTFEAGNGGELMPTDFGLVVRIRDGFTFWDDRVPTPVANDGHEFVKWYPYNPVGFVVRENITFTALFAPVEVVPVEPQIVSVTPVPVVIEQGGTVEITVTTQGMPDGAWIELNVAWRVGLSIVGGPRFYVVDNQAIITISATEDARLGTDGFAVSARAAGDWGSTFIIDSYAFVIEVK